MGNGTKIFAAGAVLLALLACGKKETYSPSCKSDATMTSPWSTMQLPVDDGRVCSSTSNRIEVQFTKGNVDEHANAFESRVLASGFAKQSCISKSCTYTRGKERLNLMRMEAPKWKTVVMWL
jgi:hypothetical protein